MSNGLVEMWQFNERQNQYLLDVLTDAQWKAKLKQGKSVIRQFTHMHNARRNWLKRVAPDLLDGLHRLGDKDTREKISTQMAMSSKAMEVCIARASSTTARITHFKHIAAFVGYMIAHEGNHRAQIEIALRQAGVPFSPSVEGRLWTLGRGNRE